MIKSAEEFVRLRTSDKMDEYNIAGSEPAPISVWLDIIARYPEMKRWVVLNRSVPLGILEILATDADSSVRATVANKRKLSLALFELLSRDVDEVVRQRIAYNKKVPPSILRRLSMDASSFVREAAIKHLAGF